MSPIHDCVIAILAGGLSRRMGQDKAALRLDGPTTLLERTTRMALEAVNGDPARVQIIGRTAPSDWPLPGVTFLPDTHPNLGPLGGLVTALHHADTVLLLACDMPALSVDALRWLQHEWESLADSTPFGLAATRDGQIEPLFAIYTAACLPEAERRIQENRRSQRGLILGSEFPLVAVPDHLAHTLTNLNTPDDLARYRGES